MKYVRVTMPDHSKWDIPAEVIAESKAGYLAYNDTQLTEGEEFNKIYGKEYKFAMENNDELIDWLENNVSWEDIKGKAVRVLDEEEKLFNYEDGLMHGKKEVIEQ